MKAAALELGVAILEPQRPAEILDELRAFGADAFVVASYGRILPQKVLDVPKLGAFNVHPSLLPLYRGATPLQAQIRDLRATTGVTIILMDAGMDTGDIVVQESSALGARETYGELHDRLANDGARLLERALELAEADRLPRTPQAGLAAVDEGEIAATLTHPLKPPDLQIDWTRSASRVDALIRSLSPQPAARSEVAGVRCKILAAHPVERYDDGADAPGTAWTGSDGGLCVACGEGAVEIERLVPPNRPEMSGAAFVASLRR